LILDGLTYEDERVFTTAVHEYRLLNVLLSTLDAVSIGRTAFTQYPFGGGEDAAIRPGTPHGRFIKDAEVKIVDLIAQCNKRTTKETDNTTQPKPAYIKIDSVRHLKDKVSQAIKKIKEAKTYAELTPR
jgi:hypothetical protein